MRNNLKVLRVKRDLTQEQAAEKLNVSLVTYNLIENGKRDGSLKFWQRLQREFNLTADELQEAQQNCQ